jgi:predicted transcriptional regulator
MRDQRSSPLPAGQRSDEVQFLVLALLLDAECRGPWSVEELVREVGCELAAADAVVRLHAAGLVHRCQELVFPTRAASRFCQLLRE